MPVKYRLAKIAHVLAAVLVALPSNHYRRPRPENAPY